MTAVWFTSDLHIGHGTIAKLRATAEGVRIKHDEDEDYQSELIEWHDQWLADWWDNLVGKDDIVWVLGDISSGTKSGQLGALQWISDRPGQKRLIAGNHDEAHPMHRDSYKWQPIYLETFQSVQAFARIRIPYDTEGHADAFLSHFPYHGDHGKERYVQYRLPDLGRDFIIHGHTHSQKRFGGRQLHVGVDAWHGQLVPLSDVQSYVNGRWSNKPSDPPAAVDGVTGVLYAPEKPATVPAMETGADMGDHSSAWT